MKNTINELYTEKVPHLKELITQNGIKNIYDAVSQCSRCGYCETVCPTYKIEKRETLSPRGRNQIIKQLIEGKFKNLEQAKEAIDTCLLCGACTSVCYAKVPTADIILEARREFTYHGKSIFYNLSLWGLKNKKISNPLIKIMFLFKKIGLAFVSEKLGLFYFLNMPGINKAQKELLNPSLKFLSDFLKKDKRFKENISPSWIYFSSCGTEYIYNKVGKATIDLLFDIYGDGILMKNECCGLIAYNYGNLKEAKDFALKNIEIYENLTNNNYNAKIVGDCSSCVSFLKSYPQLFTDDEKLKERAEKFSKNIFDITEMIKIENLNPLVDIDKIKDKKVTIHDSCRAVHGQNISKELRLTLKPILKENLIEMKNSDKCCGGAGSFAFTKQELSEKILEDKIKNASNTQANIVIVSATSCLMQLTSGLKRMYPKMKVLHYSEFIKSIIKNSNS